MMKKINFKAMVDTAITFLKGVSTKTWIIVATSAAVATTGTVVGVSLLSHEHAFGEWSITQEATCTETGVQIRICECGEEEQERTPALGHDHSTEWTVDVEPTCETVGSKSHHCSRCEDKADVTEIAANGHSFGEWTQTLAPTCTEKGSERRDCDVCEHFETRDIDANGHTNKEAVIENKIDATCTADGSYDSVIYCSVCNTEVSREAKTITKLGHDHSTEWTVDVEPTCETVGSKSHHCSRCEDKADVTEIAAVGHTLVIDPAIAPTCTETGFTEGKHCSACGEVLVAQEEMPSSHTYSTEYLTDNDHHWQICEVCSQAGEKISHELNTNGVCKMCTLPVLPTPGILYDISADGTHYEVIGYEGNSRYVKIADEYNGLPVTTIFENAFDNSHIMSVIIPDSVTIIDDFAFASCRYLKDIVLPNNLSYVSTYSFCASKIEKEYNNCIYVGTKENPYMILCDVANENLSTYEIHPDTKIIACKAFYIIKRLKDITIPDGVINIVPEAFYLLESLESVIIGNGVTYIGSKTFSSCNALKTLTISNSVTRIDSGAFYGCPIEVINYDGTKAEWESIIKEDNFVYNFGRERYTVYCTDGEILYD